MDKDSVGYICMALDSIREAILSLHPTAEEWQQKCQSLAANSVLDEQELTALRTRLAESEGLLRQFNTCLSLEEMKSLLSRVYVFLKDATTDMVLVRREDLRKIMNHAIFMEGCSQETERLKAALEKP
jgi:hypothetical protein